MTGMLSGGVERKSSEGAQAGVRVAPWWVYLCLVVVGVGYDWYCAFKWFSGKYPYWSDPVLRGMVLTVTFCSFIAILPLCVGRAKWREAVQIFFAVSSGLFGFMFIGLVGGWPGQPK
jgi:hypothetical protein